VVEPGSFSRRWGLADLSGSVLVQPATLCDYDDRDSLCIFFYLEVAAESLIASTFDIIFL
jgi:hypothetical protein